MEVLARAASLYETHGHYSQSYDIGFHGVSVKGEMALTLQQHFLCGYGNCVLTLATPENIEVVNCAGIHYHDENELTAQLQRVLRGGSLVSAYRQRAQARVRECYDWEHVVDCYESMFTKLAKQTLLDADAVAPKGMIVHGEAGMRKL